MAKPVMVIMQGASGTGKTHVACAMQRQFMACGLQVALVSADHFMRNARGDYVFSPQKLQDAHESCFRDAASAVSLGHCVIVDNTNTRRFEAGRYIELARENGYDVQVIRTDARCWENCHGVPADIIEKQRARLEDLLDTSCSPRRIAEGRPLEDADGDDS